MSGPKDCLFQDGPFLNIEKIYPINKKKPFPEKDHLGPGSEVHGRPPKAARACTSEAGPKIVLFRMVPKWSFLLFGYISKTTMGEKDNFGTPELIPSQFCF